MGQVEDMQVGGSVCVGGDDWKTHLSRKVCSSMTGIRSSAAVLTLSHSGDMRFKYSQDLPADGIRGQATPATPKWPYLSELH